MGAVADLTTLVVGIRNLVLSRSLLAHHVVKADEQLGVIFGDLVRTDSETRVGTDMLARHQKLSSNKREAQKKLLTGPSVSIPHPQEIWQQNRGRYICAQHQLW